MSKRQWRAVGLTAMLAGLAVAVGGQVVAEGVTDSTIQIGLEAAVGSLSLDGENLGFQLAFEEANAAGGVHGRRFVWTERRRRSGEPADVLAVARQMIDEDHVFALVNFSGPAIGDIVAHARTARVPVLFPHTALVSSEGERYLFTSFPRFEGESEVMFRYLAEDRGLRRLAIVHDPNAYGAGFRDRLKAHAARFGYTFAGAVPIATRRPGDLSAELATLTAANPDAIVMALYPEQAQALMAARARADWRGRDGVDRTAHRRGLADRSGRQRRRHAWLLPLPRPRAQRRPGRGPLPRGAVAPAAGARRSIATRSTATRSAGWSSKAPCAPAAS